MPGGGRGDAQRIADLITPLKNTVPAKQRRLLVTPQTTRKVSASAPR